MKKHTIREIEQAAELDEGFCLGCGHRQEMPDLEGTLQTVAQCEQCWEFCVIAAEEVLENLEIVDLDVEGGE